MDFSSILSRIYPVMGKLYMENMGKPMRTMVIMVNWARDVLGKEGCFAWRETW